MIVGCILALIGYILLLTTKGATRYGGAFFVAVGVFPCPPMVMGKWNY